MTEDLELDISVLTFEFEAIDADPARPLQTAGAPLPEEKEDGGQDRDRAEPDNDSKHGRVFDCSPGMGRALEQQVEVLEEGNVSILYRPRVEHDEVESLADVQRLLILLSPSDRRHQRVIAAGRKRLRDRFWGFIDVVDDPLHIAATLDAHTYLTKTRGARYLPAARIAADGTYSLTAHEEHTHFEFTAALHEEREIDVETSVDFVVRAANPDPAAWGLVEAPPLQEELFPEYEVHVEVPARRFADRFQGRRYIPLERDMLDMPGVELIFIDTRRRV